MAIMDHDKSLIDSERTYRNHLLTQRQSLEKKLAQYRQKEEAWRRERAQLLAQNGPIQAPIPVSDELKKLRQESFQWQVQVAQAKESATGLLESVTQSSALVMQMLWAATSASESVKSILPALTSQVPDEEPNFRTHIEQSLIAYIEGGSGNDGIVMAMCGIIQNVAATDDGREVIIKGKLVEILLSMLVSVGNSEKEAQIKTRVLAALSNLVLSHDGIQQMKEQKAVSMLLNCMSGEPNEAIRDQCVILMHAILSESQFDSFESRQAGYDFVRELQADPSSSVRQSASRLLEAYITHIARQDLAK